MSGIERQSVPAEPTEHGGADCRSAGQSDQQRQQSSGDPGMPPAIAAARSDVRPAQRHSATDQLQGQSIGHVGDLTGVESADGFVAQGHADRRGDVDQEGQSGSGLIEIGGRAADGQGFIRTFGLDQR